MAHTKAQRAARVNKDSISKRLGVKKYGGEVVKPGNIIIRQRGSTYKAGPGTYMGKDFTVHAAQEGVVEFKKKGGEVMVTVRTA